MTSLIAKRSIGGQSRVDGTSKAVADVRLLAPDAQDGPRAGYVLTTAELAPCTCPEFCERDHENE